MPKLVVVDRETPMLLPPAIQDWVGEDDIAHFIVESVEAVEEGLLHYNYRNSGSEQYPPRMMLALLIYSYAHGVMSSRKIERSTHRDVGARYITGDHHPDHDTIATFRRNNGEVFRHTFTQVLKLGARMGVGRVGAVSLDGSTILGNAARERTLSREQLEAEERELEEIVAQLEKQAEETDQAEDAAGHTEGLPAALREAQNRKVAIAEALELMKEQSATRHTRREQERGEFERRRREDESPGTPPVALPAEPGAQDTINLTDPQARLMKPKRGGASSGPGYNAQLAVCADPAAPLVVAAAVTDEANDRGQLETMVEQTVAHAPHTERVHVDTGYDNTAQIFHCEQTHRVMVCCPPAKPARQGGTSRRSRQRQRTAQYREGMAAGMRGAKGRESRVVRRTTVEPVFGWIKHTLGFRRFHLRGLERVNAEWDLVCIAHNLKLLHRLRGRQGR